MSEPKSRPDPWRTSAALAVFWSMIVSAALVLAVGEPPPRAADPDAEDPGPPPARPIARGVKARLVAGDLTAERWLPTPAFALEPGAALDRRIPPGPFRAEIEVGFDPRWVRRASFGLEFAGGSVRLESGGRVLIDEPAPEGELARTVFSETVPVSRPLAGLFIVFQSTGERPSRLRALWRPEGHRVDHPLPAETPAWTEDDVLCGEAIVQVRSCVACHRSEVESRNDRLFVHRGPVLDGVGSRLRPEGLRVWLADPPAAKPGTSMPRLFGDDPASREAIEDLTHFLASLGGPARGAERPDPDLVATGRVAYRRIGCFACHGDLEAEGAVPLEPLGPVAAKWTAPALASFLRDPASLRPRGRMPGMALAELEAKAIAAYLLERFPDPAPSGPFAIDPARAARGREAFVLRRCRACHDLEGAPVDDPARERPLPLESLPPDRGCLDPARRSGVRFDLSRKDRERVGAFLASLRGRRCEDVPVDRVGTALLRENCLACHAYAGAGGPPAALERFFTPAVEADLGDEGRFPPPLTDAGARLTLHWLTELLEGEGRSRPHVAVRMPRFPAGTAGLARDLARAAGVSFEPDDGPVPGRDEATVGRQLVGAGGHACISCHVIAGRPATGTPGPDLAGVPERVRYRYFVRWLARPTAVRSHTRMPSFFEQLGATETAARIDAIWAYLSLGHGMPLPDGLARDESLLLAVAGEPIVVRTFLAGVGPRAIACGYPEGVHLAWDAAEARLRYVWDGAFLDIGGAWAGRGGQEADPAPSPLWTSPPGPDVVVADRLPDPWPPAVDPELFRFRGYRFDHERRPVFLSRVQGGGRAVEVSEQPIPGPSSLRRRFAIEGPPGTVVWLRAREGPRRVELPPGGRIELETELSW